MLLAVKKSLTHCLRGDMINLLFLIREQIHKNDIFTTFFLYSLYLIIEKVLIESINISNLI